MVDNFWGMIIRDPTIKKPLKTEYNYW